MGTRGSVSVGCLVTRPERPSPRPHQQLRKDTEAQRGAATGAGPTPLKGRRDPSLLFWRSPRLLPHSLATRPHTPPTPDTNTLCQPISPALTSSLGFLPLPPPPRGAAHKQGFPQLLGSLPPHCAEHLFLLSHPSPAPFRAYLRSGPKVATPSPWQRPPDIEDLAFDLSLGTAAEMVGTGLPPPQSNQLCSLPLLSIWGQIAGVTSMQPADMS